jgi:hypothetical protein
MNAPLCSKQTPNLPNPNCFRWHSIIKPPDFSLVTFLTSLAQFLIFFSIAKCDNLVSGIPPSLLFKTINRDQTDDEICAELAPQGVTHVKRFISKRNGQQINLPYYI